jgi:uncharacterized membrane-anchored protein
MLAPLALVIGYGFVGIIGFVVNILMGSAVSSHLLMVIWAEGLPIVFVAAMLLIDTIRDHKSNSTASR